MSKKPNLNQSNTLLNYFSSPKSANNTPVKNGDASSKPKSNLPQTPKRKQCSDNEDDVIPLKAVKKQSKKRIRIIADDSDSDSENVQVASNSAQPFDFQKYKRVSNVSPVPKKQKHEEAQPGTSKSDADVVNDDVVNDDVEFDIPSTVEVWPHTKFKFLQPEHITDANRRRPNDPDYDRRTVFVPKDFLNDQTPAMQQWWIIKSKNMDTVLLFKVGKFYELYHMDAVVGVNDLGFSYMKGAFAHSGFPESAYAKMAVALTEQGHKIGRVEQMETPDMMAERLKGRSGGGKAAKVVNREVCQITTKATTIYGPIQNIPRHQTSVYLYALTERPIKNSYDNCYNFGVCFIDTSVGTFRIAQFEDDKYCSRLLVLFAQYPPGLVLMERNYVSEGIQKKVNASMVNGLCEMLKSGSQFYSSARTLQLLKESIYFRDAEGKTVWPKALKECIDENDSLQETCKPQYDLAVSAVGACLYHLTYAKLAIQLFTLQRFEMYYPSDANNGDEHVARDYMVLDNATVDNLKLLGNKGSLLRTLDKTCTAFGKRTLSRWICCPLHNISAIEERQDAIRALTQKPDILQHAREILKSLPDFERSVLKIHTFGNKLYANEHPDSRAIFYEAKTYSKRKILELVTILRGFETAQEFNNIFANFDSSLIKKITQRPPVGTYIDVTKTLKSFAEQFDFGKAEKDGKIIPDVGVDVGFDEIETKIAGINVRLNKYLKEQEKFFGCKISYFGTDKKRYQLDVSENKAHKATLDYVLEGSKKGTKANGGTKRYSTYETKELLAEMQAAEQERETIIVDINRRVFEQFSKDFDTWKLITENICTLDILCSFAEYVRTSSNDVCIPEILPAEGKPMLHIEGGRHPCSDHIENFVPNDTVLGVNDYGRVLLLTGPNMGGKSTLMRQVALLCILAQMGCLVPAKRMKLSLVDRIFTRLGARDDIIAGQSTFMVELTEAGTILKHATKSSLILIDELGRGTSTHDGTAIATAYVKKLRDMQCRTIFSTHYHSLVESYSNTEGFQLGHMACMVETEEDDISERNVTFLYKLVAGSCPKSYGFYVARLAGLPAEIIQRGLRYAREMEVYEKMRLTSRFLLKMNHAEIRQYFQSLRENSRLFRP